MILAHRQRGQSLVLASVALMAVALVLLLMFNAAQITRSKMELQNTADATAFSVATIAARDYNFSAYMNRAMVANQVAVAQMVGLTSWFRFTGETMDNVSAFCAVVPGLDVICLAIDETYHEYEQVFEDSVFPVIMTVLNTWMRALSDLQMVFHYGNVEAILQNLAYGGGAVQTGVLALNDPHANLVAWPDKSGDIPGELYRLAILIKDAADWWKFTSRYDAASEGMGRFAEVTGDSVDDFSKSRAWSLGGTIFDTDWVLNNIPAWLRHAIQKLMIVSISGSMKVSLERKGGTELKAVNDKYSWSAADTLMADEQIDIQVSYPCGIKWCKWHGVPYICGIEYCSQDFDEHVDLPLGWGSAYSTAPSDSTTGEEILHSGLDGKQYGGAAAGPARPTFELAVGEFGEEPLANFSGLLPYYDVKDTGAKTRDGPQLTIVVGKNLDKLRTAAQAGFGAPAGGIGPFGLDNLRLDESWRLDSFYAISKGKLHFGQSAQYSNLFSPYWEAKLADTTDDERNQAYITLFGWHDMLPHVGSANPAGLSDYAP